ncbi:MAG: hypothetical protein HUJ65_02030, partial [Oscillospiraceae bacterium]|nr:hypothetical protein [Oscillospiraceae bacterium]
MATFIIILIYVFVTLIVGIFISRKNKGSGDFFAAQGRLALPLCLVLLLASSFAGAFTAGSARDSYISGFAPYFPMVAMGMGYALFAFLVPMYRSAAKAGYLSVPEAFEARFDSRSKTALLLINSLAYGATFAVQPVALATIIAPMLGVDNSTVMWIVAAVMVVMALTGLTGVAWMNTFHCIIMVAGMTIISIVAMTRAGGIGNIVNTVDPAMFNPFSPDAPTVIMRFIALTLCVFAESEAATIAISGKTVKTAKTALIIIGVVIFVFSALLMMIGISAQVLVPGLENPSNTLYELSTKLGAVFSFIASIAVIAAITSSAPAYLIYFSTGVTRQVVGRFFPEAAEKRTKLISTVCIIAVAAIGTFFAQKATSILNVLFNVYEILTVCGTV